MTSSQLRRSLRSQLRCSQRRASRSGGLVVQKKRETVIPQTSKSKEIYDREYHAQKFCQERFFSVSLLGCERFDSEPTQRQIELERVRKRMQESLCRSAQAKGQLGDCRTKSEPDEQRPHVECRLSVMMVLLQEQRCGGFVTCSMPGFFSPDSRVFFFLFAVDSVKNSSTTCKERRAYRKMLFHPATSPLGTSLIANSFQHLLPIRSEMC